MWNEGIKAYGIQGTYSERGTRPLFHAQILIFPDRKLVGSMQDSHGSATLKAQLPEGIDPEKALFWEKRYQDEQDRDVATLKPVYFRLSRMPSGLYLGSYAIGAGAIEYGETGDVECQIDPYRVNSSQTVSHLESIYRLNLYGRSEEDRRPFWDGQTVTQ